MTPPELELKQRMLEQKIYARAIDKGLSSPLIEPIADGLCDCSEYLSLSPKVLWVLKEPYDDVVDGVPQGGGWSIPRDCFAKESQWNVKSWQTVIYIMYGLRHHLLYNDMPYVRDNPSMGNVLKSTCWINASKMPSYTSSENSSVVRNFKDYWMDIVKEQISLYNPDIIVFSGCLLRNDSIYYEFLDDKDWQSHKTITYKGYEIIRSFVKSGKLILDVYHPSQRLFSHEKYVNSIINEIECLKK